MRTDVARRRRSSQWVAISFSSILPAKKGSSVSPRPAGTKAWSLQSERFGMHRGEEEPEQMAEREHMIRDAAAVGVMDGDVDVAAVIQKPVADVHSIGFGHRMTSCEMGVAGRSEGEKTEKHLCASSSFRRPRPVPRAGCAQPIDLSIVRQRRRRPTGDGLLRGHHPRQGRVAQVVGIGGRRNLRVPRSTDRRLLPPRRSRHEGTYRDLAVRATGRRCRLRPSGRRGPAAGAPFHRDDPGGGAAGGAGPRPLRTLRRRRDRSSQRPSCAAGHRHVRRRDGEGAAGASRSTRPAGRRNGGRRRCAATSG